MKAALIYARVSSDKQREEHTIASQTAALRIFAQEQNFSVPDEWVIEDEGYSGATLVRPGLERVRDLVAEGQVDAVLVHSPDRLSRKYAYQVLLLEEFARNNVQTMFVKAPQTATPEDVERWVETHEIKQIVVALLKLLCLNPVSTTVAGPIEESGNAGN